MMYTWIRNELGEMKRKTPKLFQVLEWMLLLGTAMVVAWLVSNLPDLVRSLYQKFIN